jgi:hypothetical protein
MFHALRIAGDADRTRLVQPLQYSDGSFWFFIRPPAVVEGARKTAVDPRAVYDSIFEELKVKRAFAAAGGIRRGELAQYLTEKLKAKNKDQVCVNVIRGPGHPKTRMLSCFVVWVERGHGLFF